MYTVEKIKKISDPKITAFTNFTAYRELMFVFINITENMPAGIPANMLSYLNAPYQTLNTATMSDVETRLQSREIEYRHRDPYQDHVLSCIMSFINRKQHYYKHRTKFRFYLSSSIVSVFLSDIVRFVASLYMLLSSKPSLKDEDSFFCQSFYGGVYNLIKQIKYSSTKSSFELMKSSTTDLVDLFFNSERVEVYI